MLTTLMAWDSPGPAPCACDEMMLRGPEALLHPFAYSLVLGGVVAAVFLAISQIVTRRRAREGPETTSPEDEEATQDDLRALQAQVRLLLALVSVVAVTSGIIIRLLS